jgi:hypothetical protein
MAGEEFLKYFWFSTQTVEELMGGLPRNRTKFIT